MSDDKRLVSTAEAEELTGVPAGTIRSAAARDIPGQPGVKQLAQWGLDADGRKLYRLGEVRELAATTRRRRRAAAADTPK